ncbi:MAG: carboxylating nicotinate-nucleotide diphosphorylase [Candidatus Anstonellaceae archaeon]
MWNFNRSAHGAFAKKVALAALAKDAKRDITSEGCIAKGARCIGKIVAKSNFVLCGILEADAIFASRKVKAKWNFSEGARVRQGEAICRISGNCRSVLACERVALNYLSLLSGIATKSTDASARYGKWKISATRKTLPMLSDSEKRAVRVGGCLTHRMDLSDGILIKDNHLAAIMKEKKTTRARAVEIAARSFSKADFVEVEVSSVAEAVAAAKAGAKAILVDNVSPSELRKIVNAARKLNGRIVIEASGGITLANAGIYLKAGANFVSTSELTMSIEPADLSLEIDSF